MARKFDPLVYGTKTMSQRDIMSKAMAKGYAGAKMIGSPMKPPMKPMMKGKKMSKEQVAKRKRSMITNAAAKTMGGLYSK